MVETAEPSTRHRCLECEGAPPDSVNSVSRAELELSDEIRCDIDTAMDILPSGGIFRELQVVHDTGYFSGHPSFEEDWHQVIDIRFVCENILQADIHIYSL